MERSIRMALESPPGINPSEHQKICKACRAVLHPKAEICPNCGVRQFKPISKAALLLFTFFLGGFGAHKFYLGKYIQGIFYILFSWTFIPSFVAFIEFIIYIFTNEDRLQERYPDSSGGVAIAVVVGGVGFIALIGILAAIAIPNFVSYRSRAACITVENEARMASQAVNEYLLNNDTTAIPTLEDLSRSTGYSPNQRVGIDIKGDKDQVVITGTDLLKHCRKGSAFFISIPEDASVDGWQ
jgi:TM2 domain-containing membrane protein YozV/Tfp pilus assembly major pilin PilA